MAEPTQKQTLIVPARRTTSSFIDRATTGLAPDLLSRAASRLQVLALLYAFTFFMAAFFTPIVLPEAWDVLVSRPLNWIPGVISIATAVLVALAIRVVPARPAVVTAIALVFEVAGSYGIAAAEFLHPLALTVNEPWIGLSWVSVWMLLFNVVVPTVPRVAVIAALASVTSVPAMVLLSMWMYPPEVWPGPARIFLGFGFPYLLVAIMAYVGARIVYNLGTEVTRARELGSYRLEERLGQGGMGEVWKASHRLLARPAAIKLIRAAESANGGGSPEDMRRRFEREAQVIAQLRSPHTVTLFDYGIADDGSCYYVMELLDGIDADTLIKRFGPISAERVVHIVRQMCHSLSEAESHGLVHRDIKPANIFVCRYGEDHDFVKVLDFGIAKAVHSPTAQTEMALTVPNLIHGTPAFIAPEQALGSADVDARADIYSTGCVAYWLLTGELVFTADTPMKLLLAHAHMPAEPPSARTELPIPPDLDALVLSCLAKDRALRPPSARELLQRLDAIALQHDWNETRARRWWNEHLPPAAV